MNAVWHNLPALQIIVPLFGALTAGLLRRGGAGFLVALAVSWVLPFLSGARCWPRSST